MAENSKISIKGKTSSTGKKPAVRKPTAKKAAAAKKPAAKRMASTMSKKPKDNRTNSGGPRVRR